jgi:valyl-tRNA synthetase
MVAYLILLKCHRATPQWFANIESIKQSAIDAMEAVDFKPEQCESFSTVWYRAYTRIQPSAA